MIQVEQTPNPDSLKFLSQKILSKVGTEEFKKSNLNNIKTPFIKEVLSFSGVELVLISDNFLTVKKIKKAKTDTDPITENIKDYENRPEAYNLLSIYSDLSDQKIETTINEFIGKDFSSLKTKLSEKLVETISPIGKNIAKLMKEQEHLEDVLKKGKQKANIIAEENLKKIREIVGFV